MAIEKCNYCGRELDEVQFGTLDNGSKACVWCVNDEEKRMTERAKSQEDNKKKGE